MDKLKVFVMKRITNYAFWVGVFAFVCDFSNQTGLFTIPANAWSYIDIVLKLLIFVGIVINPTTKGFGDGKELIETVVTKIDPKDAKEINAIIDEVFPYLEPTFEAEMTKIRELLKTNLDIK